MNSKSILLIFLIHLLYVTQGQAGNHRYADVQIKLLSGEIKEGKLQFPILSEHTRIVFKKNEDAEKETIKADEIDYLIITTSKENSFLLKRSQTYNPKKKLSKGKNWLFLKINCKNFNSFLLVEGFDINSVGDFFAFYLDNMGMYLIQQSTEDFPTEVGIVFLGKVITQGSFDKQRKKFLLKYYEKDPEALAFINSKKKVKQEELVEYLESKCEK
ncbi:MAG: hypothetical protein LKG19_08360 [Saprospiraceae bacterium]|jgi:hypothetical protein|nr:hypothetical protein [Saprospiraceae bacterium]